MRDFIDLGEFIKIAGNVALNPRKHFGEVFPNWPNKMSVD